MLSRLELSREWKKRNRERHAELARAYRRRNPEKVRAQNQLNYAIRMGRIQRKPCEACGTQDQVHAHHHDYALPFDVKWLCFQCHKDAHPVEEEHKAIKFEDAKHASLPGEKNPNSKLSNDEAREIRRQLSKGISQKMIADAVGVHQTTISRISRHFSYENV